MSLFNYENGLRAVADEKQDTNVSAIVVHVTGGCQSEKNSQSGLSQYVSKLLLCGTKKYPSREQLVSYAKLNGIILNSHASRESITLSAICSNETIEWAIELLSEIVFDSNFDEEAGKQVKKRQLAEVDRLSENYKYQQEKSSNQALFYRTGLANPKYGTALTINRFDSQTAKEFWQTLVTPKNTVVSIVGDIDEETFFDLVDKHFASRLPASEEYKKLKYVSAVEDFSGDLRTRNKRLNQSRIRIAFPTYGYKSSKKYLPQILIPIISRKLAKEISSPLYYSALEVSTKHFANNGKIEFDAVVDSDYSEEFLLKITKAIKELATSESISESDFELEKNLFTTSLLYKYDNILEFALASSKEMAIQKRSFNLSSEKLKIDMLTIKDANKYLTETFVPTKMFVSYLGYPITLAYDELI